VTEKVQVQTAIGKMGAEVEAEAKDPAEKDYDIGKAHLGSGDHAAAAAAFHNALIGYEQANNENGIANAVNQLGDICVARKDFEQALVNFKRAYEICERLDDPFSLLALRKKIAQLHCDLKQYDEAISCYGDLIDTYKDFNNPPGAIETLEKLAAVSLKKGDTDRAADAYRTAAAIHENFKHRREAEALRGKADALDGK
jgi:tetratricopeptide (TPR) repeat protein